MLYLHSFPLSLSLSLSLSIAMVVSPCTKNPSTPTRPPLIPSEKTNGAGAALHKKPVPKSKDVTSRYLSSPSPLPKRAATSASRARPLDRSSPPPATTNTTTRSLSVSFQGHSFSLHAAAGDKPVSAKPRTPRPPLARSLEGKDPVLAAIRLLQQHHSIAFEHNGDSDSLSSSSGSSSRETRVPLRPAVPRGVSVPARFRAPKSGDAKKKDPQLTLVSPRRTPASPPLKRAESSPIGTPRSGGAGRVGNFSSVMNFAAEAKARRGKTGGESRVVEEAHALRLLYNRYLQWRCANARADAALSAQRHGVEQNLYNTAITLSEMHDSVALKGIELQLRTQDLKLSSILEGQMTYLEEWSIMDIEHRNSVSGAIEALKASTLRLPIVGGARADIHELQNAVGSAVEVMQALGTSTHSLLLKVEGANALVSELAKAAAHERTLLDQSKDLLSTVAAMHVKQCSLQGHILQSKRNATDLLQC